MTILTAVQAAQARLVGRRSASVVSSQDEIDVETTALAQEAAVDIMKAHDWQMLTRLWSITASDTSGAFPLPPDYDRMALASRVHSPSWPNWTYSMSNSLDEWLRIQDNLSTITPGWWIILDGQFQVFPALNAGEQAKFFYISNNVFRAANQSPKNSITQDDDSFALDERLLTLSVIWRWKQMKQMEYAEDLRNYEVALSQNMARDKGSRAIRDRPQRFHGAVPAWPWALGGS